MAHMVVIIRSHLGDGMWDFGQVHQLAGAKGVRRREFWPSIVPEQHTLLRFQGARVSVHPARAQVWSIEALGQEGVVTTSISVMRVWVCFSVLSDVRPGYCYTALANGRCSNQLPQSITKMQCCCDAGRCWSPGVTVAPEMCPIRATGKSPSGYLQRIPAPPAQAQWQCAWGTSRGSPGKWTRFWKMKDTTPREISPDNDLGNYRGPYKWYRFLVLPLIELAYYRRIATFSGGLVLSYSHVFLLALKESSKAPLNQTHFSAFLSYAGYMFSPSLTFDTFLFLGAKS